MQCSVQTRCVEAEHPVCMKPTNISPRVQMEKKQQQRLKFVKVSKIEYQGMKPEEAALDPGSWLLTMLSGIFLLRSRSISIRGRVMEEEEENLSKGTT